MHLTSKDAVATNVGMRSLFAFAFALSACGFNAAPLPDAALDSGHDAARTPPVYDAAPVGTGGCMGNLPNSRTVTVNTGDPIPANIINELQDISIGAKRGQYTRQVFIPCWSVFAGGVAAAVENTGTIDAPVWKLSSGTNYHGRVTYEQGEKIHAISYEGFGDGTVDIAVEVDYYPNGIVNATGGVVVGSVSRSNDPASWGVYSLTVATPVSMPDASGAILLRIDLTGGGTFYRFGNLILTLSKP